ncbi:PREDICTED: rapid alkalinization factor-like [Ipomoea nil]|uniref:rapid alkalinization factor-like n=1 Tax=Ipomoea nil TaxID=35883 RepID=UPI0009016891|nr:PREDICTED: rapid alkalinization factor-like [Ipomoea nil]
MAKKVKSTGFLAICAIFIITAVLSSPAAVTASAGAYEIGYFPMAMPSASSKICDGSVGECLSDDEFELDSESNRRILAYRQRYISYGALSRNRVPCSRRGASYYNCRPGAPANPYRRGCSAITRCRG